MIIKDFSSRVPELKDTMAVMFWLWKDFSSGFPGLKDTMAVMFWLWKDFSSEFPELKDTMAVMFWLPLSSFYTISSYIPDPFSQPLPIIHCFRQVFRATSRIGTELLYIGSSWSSCLCSSMWKGPHSSGLIRE